MNQFFENNVAAKEVTPITVRATAGGDTTVIAAPGAGKRLRIYSASLSQQGTAAADASLKVSGSDIFKARLSNDGRQTFWGDGRSYYTLPENIALVANITDQASDSFDINVNYTLETV